MSFPTTPISLTTTSTDREIMGYPEAYVATRCDDLHRLMLPVMGMSADALIAICESVDAPLEQRLGAGTLLGILGDPRIDTLNPAMVEVSGGTVTIGLAYDDLDRVVGEYAGLFIDRAWIEKECPAHQVELKPYRIARYPVTNNEFRTFLLDTGYPEIPTSWELGSYPDHRANHPVYTVTAAAADAYAAWLAERTGRSFRLPTEAEWEYAAAGPERWTFPWGERFVQNHANTIESGVLRSTPVGIFPNGRSPFGADDMAGNVEEYVAEDYVPYPGGPRIVDDLVDRVGDYRVARGGSFSRFRDLARCQRRHGHYPRAVYVMGFRLVDELL